MRVVDLGCKKGGAILEFIRRGSIYFGPDVSKIANHDCLGVEINPDYKKAIRDLGCNFLQADLSRESDLSDLPEADYYLAWDFLEHLPSVDIGDRVFHAMLELARVGVWLRMPSFEDDLKTGEGALRKLGLRFAWTHWHGHTSFYRLSHAHSVVGRFGRDKVSRVLVRGNRMISNTNDPAVVPVNAPVDTVKYRPELGKKIYREFDPKLVGQWEFIVVK